MENKNHCIHSSFRYYFPCLILDITGIVGRNKEEQEIFKLLRKHRKISLYSIVGKTALDKHFKKHFSFENLKINIGCRFSFKENYYLNIFHNFILEIYLDTKLVEKIEKFYQENTDMSLAKMKEFERLIKQKYPIRMKISRNIKKARKLRKQLSKDFYLPNYIEI